MAEVEKYTARQIGVGFKEYTMKSFGDLVDFLRDDILDYNSYVWRGQRDPAWKLAPTISRISNNNPAQVMHHEVLGRFKQAARGRRGPNPPQLTSDNDWWALGQHHGLATPLLDWSTSPFVAAFFAYLEPYPKEPKVEGNLAEEIKKATPKFRAIYALHSAVVEQWAVQDLATAKSALAKRNAESTLLVPAVMPDGVKPVMEFVRPMSDENQRLINQGGLFTRFYGPFTIEEWIPTRHPETLQGSSLLKILVPDTDRVKALTLLNRMNINPLSLFPDLIGASMYSNLHAEIPNY